MPSPYEPPARAANPVPIRRLAVAALALVALTTGDRSTKAEDQAITEGTHVMCLAPGDDCRTRLIRLPDGQPGQVLKFEFCREGDCDRQHREHWSVHYLVPPPGEVCRNTNITEALQWLEQNRPRWLLAGWGCVSGKSIKLGT